jgi:hypothetical protein
MKEIIILGGPNGAKRATGRSRRTAMDPISEDLQMTRPTLLDAMKARSR